MKYLWWPKCIMPYNISTQFASNALCPTKLNLEMNFSGKPLLISLCLGQGPFLFIPLAFNIELYQNTSIIL